MNREEWDKTTTEQNAKAEGLGAAIAILWFVGLFILLPLAILFPPILFLVGFGIVWMISTYRKNNKRKN